MQEAAITYCLGTEKETTLMNDSIFCCCLKSGATGGSEFLPACCWWADADARALQWHTSSLRISDPQVMMYRIDDGI